MDITPLLKHTSRSLYLSVQALPRTLRTPFGIAYLLCRYADTIADTYLIPQERRLYWIERFPSIVRQNDRTGGLELAKEISGSSDNPHEKELLQNLGSCLDVFNTLSELHQQFIHEVVSAVCEGMKMDLTSFPSQTADEVHAFATHKDLEKYCRLMGGMPGLFWSKLIFHSCTVSLPEKEFYALGQHIGDALQIVNILRDLPKDLRIGRCYLPLEDLAAYHLTPKELLSPAASAAFEPVKQKWIQWGIRNLTSAGMYFRQLPKTQPGTRAAVAWPMLWTADTLYKVSTETALLSPARRVKISHRVIYGTMALTPLILLSNQLFMHWMHRKIKRFGIQ